MEKSEAEEQTDVGAVHRVDLAAHANEVAARERTAVLIDDVVHVASDGAEVAVLHVGVDVERAADVVVGDDGDFGGAESVATSARISGLFALDAVMGMFCRSCSDWIRYCGVWATML